MRLGALAIIGIVVLGSRSSGRSPNRFKTLYGVAGASALAQAKAFLGGK